MRFGGNDFNYFLENKLTKLANFVQFKRMLLFCLEDWGRGVGPPWLRHWTQRTECNALAWVYLFDATDAWDTV